MGIRFAQVCIFLTIAWVGLLTDSRSASACSGDPSDYWAAADLVVLARVVSVEMLTEGVSDGADGYPVRITAQVLETPKGEAPARVSWVERWASGEPDAHPSTWKFTGGRGDCSTLQQNPLGRYTLAFLSRERGGELSLGFPVIGYSADPERFDEVLARYARPSRMPRTGGGGIDARSPLESMLVAAGLVGVALALVRAIACRTEDRTSRRRLNR